MTLEIQKQSVSETLLIIKYGQAVGGLFGPLCYVGK